jgi:probable phosphoglycerate mutase
MEGTRIVFVRHGESKAQELQRVAGHIGCVGLSERGRAQVAALRDRLTATRELGDDVVLFSSNMARAVETAGILAPAFGDVESIADCGWCEWHVGEDGDGMLWEEYEALYPWPEDRTVWNPDFKRDPGGESWNEMAARVGEAIDSLVDEHAGRTVVIASHGGTIVQAVVRFLNIDMSTPERRAWLGAENASLTEFRWGPNPYGNPSLDWELVRYNDFAHLAGKPALAG